MVEEHVVAAVAPAPTAEELALSARLVEANRARNRLARERDDLQERVDQLEDAIALERTRAAVAGGFRYEIRCDAPGCRVAIAVTSTEPADPGQRLARGLAAAAVAMEWVVGAATAEALRCTPFWNGEDLCPACRLKARAAGRPV